MTEYEFMLEDRIAKIQAINEQYDLLNNSYIAFSGGKDSVVLSKLIDLALPGNKIKRVYINTGIEYNDMVKYVKDRASKDERIVIVNQTRNIRKTLEKYGYPFKSKEHSERVYEFNKGNNGFFLQKYITGIDRRGKETMFKCPKSLLYQFNERGKYNFSRECCKKLKKDISHKWEKENNIKICITGMRNEEGGNRKHLTCLTSNNTKFHPLIVVTEEWENWFIERERERLCKLYYPPFNFERTGCKCCPYSLDLQHQLNKIYVLMPNEYKQIINLWKPVYDEYIRVGYRLKYYPHELGVQMCLDDFLEKEEED